MGDRDTEEAGEQPNLCQLPALMRENKTDALLGQTPLFWCQITGAVARGAVGCHQWGLIGRDIGLHTILHTVLDLGGAFFVFSHGPTGEPPRRT